MVESIVFQIGVIALELLGIYQLSRAVDKLRVFFAASFWLKTEAKLIQARVAYDTTETVSSGPPDALDQTYYHDVRETFFFTTLTTRWYYPLLRFEYQHQGKLVKTDNLAPYNRKAFYFGEETVGQIVEQYQRRNTFLIRYNPNRPGEVFLGQRHFPYFWTVLQMIIGWFFSLSFSLVSEFIFEQMGLIEPRIADRPISIFVITGLVIGYALLRIGFSCFSAKSVDS